MPDFFSRLGICGSESELTRVYDAKSERTRDSHARACLGTRSYRPPVNRTAATTAPCPRTSCTIFRDALKIEFVDDGFDCEEIGRLLLRVASFR